LQLLVASKKIVLGPEPRLCNFFDFAFDLAWRTICCRGGMWLVGASRFILLPIEEIANPHACFNLIDGIFSEGDDKGGHQKQNAWFGMDSIQLVGRM
jgi:hypothetical protein